MITEFDIVFDKICDDVFPKLNVYLKTSTSPNDFEGYVDIHDMIEFLTDEEGYDTDMAHRIWESYIDVNHKFINLLHRETDASALSNIETPAEVSVKKGA